MRTEGTFGGPDLEPRELFDVCGLRPEGTFERLWTSGTWRTGFRADGTFVNLRNLKSRIESGVSFLRRFVNLGNVSFRLLQARTSAAGEERARVLQQTCWRCRQFSHSVKNLAASDMVVMSVFLSASRTSCILGKT